MKHPLSEALSLLLHFVWTRVGKHSLTSRSGECSTFASIYIYEFLPAPNGWIVNVSYLLRDSKIRNLKMPGRKLLVVCGDGKYPNCQLNLKSDSGPLAGDIPIISHPCHQHLDNRQSVERKTATNSLPSNVLGWFCLKVAHPKS